MKRRATTSGPLRLQKYLAEAGIASRRHAEELIEAGRVLVNDEIVNTLPAFIDPKRDRVIVDGTPVRPQPLQYFIVHKPKGIVCTNRDPAGRPRAVDLLPPTKGRLNVVGRLDADSTGLLLMTNDGVLAERITHPRLGVPKVYRVEVRGQVPDDIVAKMKTGVHLAEGKARASEVEIVHRSRQSSVLRITLREGRNRQVRRMLARLDHAVKTLKRVQIGPLSLKGLPVGACRELTGRELADLHKVVRPARARRTGDADARPRARKPATASAKPQPKRPVTRRKAATKKTPDRAMNETGERTRIRRRVVT